MEKYVGIDCSSKAVHVVVLDGKEQLIDKFKWESKLKTADARFLDIVDQIYKNLSILKDTKLVCVEDFIWARNNPHATRTITAVIYSTIYFLHHYDIKANKVPIGRWKKESVGKGNASKDEVKLYAQSKWDKDTFDEQDYADAACIALYGLRKEKETENAST